MSAYKTFTHRGELTPDQISDQLGYVPIAESPYGPIASEVRIGRGDAPSGNTMNSNVNTVIADIVDEFNETDTVKIPTVEDFTTAPVYGAATLEGTGGDEIEFSQTEVNVGLFGAEFPVSKDILSQIRSKKVGDLMRITRHAVNRWFMRVRTEQITRSFYEARPLHISRASAAYIPTDLGSGAPLNKGRRHIPNFWVANQGLVAISTTHATFDSSINDSLVLLDADGSADALPNPNVLDDVYENMAYADFEPAIEIGGNPFWICYVTPEAHKLLSRNDRIEQLTESAYRGAMLKDPLLVAGDLVYRHFLIKQNKEIAWEVHHTCTNPSAEVSDSGWLVRYGPINSNADKELSLFTRQSTDTDERNLHMALVMGKRAMHIARAGRPNIFEALSRDRRTGYVYAEMACGAERNDIYRGTAIASPDSIINRSLFGIAWRVA